MNSVSILESQIGYHPEDAKKVLLRSTVEKPSFNPTGKPFYLMDAAENTSVYTGKIEYWGEKWGSYWWNLDFSPVTAEGLYYVKVPESNDLESSIFKIARTVLIDESFVTVALDQLDERLKERKKRRKPYDTITIWHDCAAIITTEITAVGIVVHGLLDAYENVLEKIPQQRVVDHIIIGADYLVLTQLSSSNPLMDGTYIHSLTSLTGSEPPVPEEKWEEHVWNAFHDMAFTITVLARAYQVIKHHDEVKAAKYLASAEKAWKCAALRPYHLPRDLRENNEELYKIIEEKARRFYNKTDPSWKIPYTLRTKEILTFLWGTTLLYDITAKEKYLDKANQLADWIAERQFVDWENPIDGAFGNFYEFEGDDNAFLLEQGQSHGWHLGYNEPTNLRGFMNLILQCPDSPKVAKWYNVIKTYSENYVKKTGELTPFKIYPMACYKDPEHGGIKFFQVAGDGHSALYGQIARNIMEIGDFLNDASYQELANQNVEFIVGLNPGFPNAYQETAWDAISLIKGIGVKSFGGSPRPKHALDKFWLAPEAPKGSGFNGFCAFDQFRQGWISEAPDGPRGILNPDGSYQFNEDWIIHSHGYISGITKLEGNFRLQVAAKHRGKPVPASINIKLKNLKTGGQDSYDFLTDSSDALEVTTLPLQRRGTISCTWNGVTVSRSLETIGSGKLVWGIDFATCLEISITVPPRVRLNSRQTGKVSITNQGADDVAVKLKLSSHGIRLEKMEMDVPVKSGQKVERDFNLTAGKKVMPYLVHARAAAGDCEVFGMGEGKVES